MENVEFSDLMELAEMISERLDNPITIEDMNHRVIAYSTHGDMTDPVRMQTIMKRKVPEAVLVRFWKEGVIQALMHTDEPVRIPAIKDVGLDNRAAISIRRGQEVLGYIWVQEAVRRIEDADLDVLKWAARMAMPRMIHRKTRHSQNEEKRRELFWQLLSKGAMDRREIEKQAADLQVHLPAVMEVLVFEAKCAADIWRNVQKELEYLLSNLNDFIPFQSLPLWTFDQRQLIVLGGLDKKNEGKIQAISMQFIEQLLKRLDQRFSGEKLMIAGYGQPVYDVLQVSRSYQQALEVIHLKQSLSDELGHVCGYHQLGVYHMFPQMARLNEQMGYRNEKLERLMEYDRQNNSNLVETLEAFLDAAGRMNRTVEVLHVHPNTLSYRLKRIGEVGDINLNDPNDRVTLFLDIKLSKYKP
ncbi:helix-turn-helix domain-containing protein [Aneurinibacillus sp. Ricciae_BoGa-3]|uniref:PucR family transcriptional regulator n=1 Tax=Aneurinibacillus sp. Ricciae_BoGa-3 TaxID=3022697 RepID=UPI002341F170|nr:helix-turn-helix domain-containing protein [Aneurinibacillus sp. Ricciae_BoGa-3]WCK54032.1 helix-turn-helix domain-containing protein [Aneurinibacillus sp. Ricciae_BoGa-3]